MGGCVRKTEGRGCFWGSGSMTVFFCLALLLIGAIICTCLESARTAGLRFMAKTASDSALQSVFADYHEELWEDYHVFFHYEQEDVADTLGEYLAYYTDPTKELYGIQDFTDLWGLNVDRVQVTSKKSGLSDGGRLFLEQAVEYEKYQIAETLLEELLNRAGLLDEIDKVRSFAVRLSGCLEQIQKISTLYQDVRDSIAAVLQLGSQIQAIFSGELPDLEASYALLKELAEHTAHLKQIAEEYLQRANDMGDLAEELASEYGESQETIYGQQISQLREFTINGLLGAAVNGVTQKADGVLAQLYSVLAEIDQLMKRRDEAGAGETEDTAVGDKTDAESDSQEDAGPQTEAGPEEETWEAMETAPESEMGSGLEDGGDENGSIYEKITAAVSMGIQAMRELEVQLDSAVGTGGSGEETDSSGDASDGGDQGEGSVDTEGQSLLELVKQWKNMAVLALVMGTDAAQTRADYFSEPSELPSSVVAESLSNVSAAEKGLFIFYITDTFTSVLSDRQKNYAYQQEYILFGKPDSRSNLTAMAESLLAVREGLNLAFLLTNTQMRALAETAAYALVGATGLYPLVLITQFVILAAWAFAESVADVRALFRGEAVSLWKTEATWKTSISGLVEEVIDPESAVAGTGAVDIQLYYGDYLKLFLLVNDTQTLCLRSMDIIQQEIGSSQQGFLMADCCGAADVTVSFSSSYRLITLPLVGGDAGGEHRIEAVSSYKYK